MPSSRSCLTVFSPSGIIGIFTTTLVPNFVNLCASSIIPSVSIPTTSSLTGPLISFVIFLIISAGCPFSLDKRVGLVVTPSTTPISLYRFMDSIFAVSRKIFISLFFSSFQELLPRYDWKLNRICPAVPLFHHHVQTHQTYQRHPFSLLEQDNFLT